jgi:hypothetical protein
MWWHVPVIQAIVGGLKLKNHGSGTPEHFKSKFSKTTRAKKG